MADSGGATFDPAVLARLRGLPRGQLVTLLRGLSEAELRTLHESWAIWALPGQREPGQLHFAVRTRRGLVHADATLRRVVERPGPVEAPVLGCWRIGEGNSGEVGPWRH
ncbi:hypothetical protein [Sphingomonas sp. TWP1-3-1]|uniref:hypothetical protein n=1 Tax=Sphingomonas sp. TWP1-3-1 TaxID=2804612 RepID=UPI003CF825AD